MVQDNTPKLAVGPALFTTIFFWSTSKRSEGPAKYAVSLTGSAGVPDGKIKIQLWPEHGTSPTQLSSFFSLYIPCSEGPFVIPDSFALTAFWMNCAQV